ncbi:molecular chaperone Tir [Sphingomonas oleivorans]|uniref:Molecular chaperone Tir n=1 Tax=Sphingomonas oleivorans TaxID=1735121 RepID=A0A2T5FZ78_9SPHN|nr:toll/interleukin-1 receptor domain-containing protein [Sphingomonas oleivorans]PTQ12006.1 molecular chaperone Tir [Sphingomonas oleivorans]
MSQSNFFKGFMEDTLEQVMSSYADELHGTAASVVDPETGKHALVFVRRIGKDGWVIHTSGSPAFARALEQRLGLNKGEVHGMNEPANRERLVYLAHASEDKALVKPLAEGLMRRGIKVWYDNWEIGYGDSLRRKMEEGLGDCTHFVVLLTETSIRKPWVNEEIDAGLMSAVEGSAKFIGLRHNLPLSSVSPFFKTRLTPEFQPGEEGLDALSGEIYGVSKKPPLGEKPRYVQSHEPGSTWAASARTVAEYFVRNSAHAQPMDPQASYAEIQQETGLPMPDVRIGVLDLIGAGLLEKQEYFGGEGHIWPKSDMFVTFDADFMDWDPEKDARDLAVHLTNLDTDQADANEVGLALGWKPRRFNTAAAYLVSARVVKPIEYMSGDAYWPCGFMMGDELLRFVRSL